MEVIKDLRGLLLHHLKNLYSAEQLQLKTLPALIKKAGHSSLKNALKHHLMITGEQKKRLEQVLKLIAEAQSAIPAAGGKKKLKNSKQNTAELKADYTCKGMEGLIEEANELLQQRLSKDVIDAAIITCVQKMEHYEICTYGTALAFAEQLQMTKVEALLGEALQEEYDADDLLTSLAISALNKEAEPEDIVVARKEVPEVIPAPVKSSKNLEHITERTINSPGGRAGTSHRRYPSGESRGH